MNRRTIFQNLKNCLTETDFLKISGKKRGKVRDVYDFGNNILMLVTTDRQSAFDRILASIPFKGQVLNQVSSFWFDETSYIINNHVLDTPDPNVIIAKKCEVIPIEFVVRGYLTGSTETSAWTHYARGERNICGNLLPDDMVKNQIFERPILTPTTKSDEHDVPISLTEILSKGIVSARDWAEIEEAVFALFKCGQEIASKNGLILVDTKYELGWSKNGELTLIDEIHTPDSSRYWIKESYAQCFSNGKEPENIDKEFLRLWFKDNCDPYHDTVLPKAPDYLVVELAHRYIQLYEMITGLEFDNHDKTPIMERMQSNLASWQKLKGK